MTIGKNIYAILCVIIPCVIFSKERDIMANDLIPNDNIFTEDCHRISVYQTSIINDSICFTPLPALYFPMENMVIIDECNYNVELNSDYNINESLSSIFKFIVGNYYTNLD